MTAPAVEIRVWLEASKSWNFQALRRGVQVAASEDGEFPDPYQAVQAAIVEIRASLPQPGAPE